MSRPRPDTAARLLAAAGAGVIVAGVVLTASRVQLHAVGPGVLPATVVVPAAALLVVAFLSARTARSFRFGLMTGFLALTASFVAVFGVLAVEGPVWMDRRGVFMLDGDPPAGGRLGRGHARSLHHRDVDRPPDVLATVAPGRSSAGCSTRLPTWAQHGSPLGPGPVPSSTDSRRHTLPASLAAPRRCGISLEALPDDGGGTKIQQQSSLPGVVGAPLGGCVC